MADASPGWRFGSSELTLRKLILDLFLVSQLFCSRAKEVAAAHTDRRRHSAFKF